MRNNIINKWLTSIFVFALSCVDFACAKEVVEVDEQQQVIIENDRGNSLLTTVRASACRTVNVFKAMLRSCDSNVVGIGSHHSKVLHPVPEDWVIYLSTTRGLSFYYTYDSRCLTANKIKIKSPVELSTCDGHEVDWLYVL